MSAKRRSASDRGPEQSGSAAAPKHDRVADATGPQSAGPWGTTGEIDRNPPWGSGEDSPLNEGSETSAVAEGSWGDRPADATAYPRGRHNFGPVEPTRTPVAGPGAPPDPAPRRRTFPDDTAPGDLPDNPIEEQTSMHPEGVSRRG